MAEPNPIDWELVYCRYIRKNGKVIYPKNGKFFRFWVKKKPVSRNTGKQTIS
jgi:hypothetical protein